MYFYHPINRFFPPHCPNSHWVSVKNHYRYQKIKVKFHLQFQGVNRTDLVVWLFTLEVNLISKAKILPRYQIKAEKPNTTSYCDGMLDKDLYDIQITFDLSVQHDLWDQNHVWLELVQKANLVHLWRISDLLWISITIWGDLGSKAPVSLIYLMIEILNRQPTLFCEMNIELGLV